MREISVSTEVFAAIWANRLDGEESEDVILHRLLRVSDDHKSIIEKQTVSKDERDEVDGVLDRRNGVHFPQGTLIVRTYKGREYAAIASSGLWLRQDNGIKYPTINQLNTSIVSGVENVWNGNWRFVENGVARSIDLLRQRARSV